MAGYRTPVIFITAHNISMLRERALAAGAIAYLTKPFDEAVLLGLYSDRVKQPPSVPSRAASDSFRATAFLEWPAPIEWSGGDVSLRLDALPA